jgi:hypothetical protein
MRPQPTVPTILFSKSYASAAISPTSHSPLMTWVLGGGVGWGRASEWVGEDGGRVEGGAQLTGVRELSRLRAPAGGAAPRDATRPPPLPSWAPLNPTHLRVGGDVVADQGQDHHDDVLRDGHHVGAGDLGHGDALGASAGPGWGGRCSSPDARCGGEGGAAPRRCQANAAGLDGGGGGGSAAWGLLPPPSRTLSRAASRSMWSDPMPAVTWGLGAGV